MKKNKSFSLNPYVLIFGVVVCCGILTFVITPGTLEDGVYKELPRLSLNFNNIFHIFRAIPYGIKESANIIVLILVVGGALEIYKKSGAIDTGIHRMLAKFGNRSKTMLLVVLLVVFSAAGGFLGWIEVLIPFVPFIVAITLAMGYDSLVGVAICILGAMGGFMAGPTNLYTVAICNGVLQTMGILPEGSDVFQGIELRLIVWIVITAVSTVYLLVYAKRIQKHPEKSLVADIDQSELAMVDTGNTMKMTLPQVGVLMCLFGAIILTVYGMKYGFNDVVWSVDDVSAVFLLSGILAGMISHMKATQIADAFLSGAKGAIGGALIVGVARGVYWILNNASLNATFIYYATEILKGMSPLGAGIGIVLLVSLINGLIPSGSGKAALLSPLLIPIGLKLGLSAQTAVLAYQFGDGITNMFWFSYGTLLIWLNYGKVPIQRWWKFFVPLMIIFFVISFVTLAVAVSIGY